MKQVESKHKQLFAVICLCELRAYLVAGYEGRTVHHKYQCPFKYHVRVVLLLKLILTSYYE